jgi:hypothetical protein
VTEIAADPMRPDGASPAAAAAEDQAVQACNLCSRQGWQQDEDARELYGRAKRRARTERQAPEGRDKRQIEGGWELIQVIESATRAVQLSPASVWGHGAIVSWAFRTEGAAMTVPSTNLVQHVIGVAACVACFTSAMPTGMAEPFTNASVNGRYSGTVTGFILEPFLPTWATIFFRADGNGQVQGVRVTFSIGGCVILDQRGGGTYQLARTGIGRATVTLTTVGAVDTEACDPSDPSISLPPPQEAEFVLEFAVNQAVPNANQVLDSIGLTFVSDPNSVSPINIASGTQGTIRRQTM